MFVRKTVKLLYTLNYLLYIISNRYFPNNLTLVSKFLNWNNKRVKRYIVANKIERVFLLLPHCVQNSQCKIRVTGEINNCVECGKCKIGDLKKISDKYCGLDIRIVTGGTLARTYIKELKPQLIVAIACKRDLISGIYDSFPFYVYGILNKIIDKECVGTDFSLEKIEEIIRFIKEEK
ncbi:MAG: DUF116 domain-containing protein [Fusobacteriaceae bacterium]